MSYPILLYSVKIYGLMDGSIIVILDWLIRVRPVHHSLKDAVAKGR